MSARKLPIRVVDELLHSAVDAAVVADREGRIVYLNREAENLFGYEADELLGLLRSADLSSIESVEELLVTVWDRCDLLARDIVSSRLASPVDPRTMGRS